MVRTHPWRRWLVLSACLALVIGALPLALAVGPARAQSASAKIGIVDFGFDPATLEVAVGTTVTWKNRGATAHTVTADDGTFDSGSLDPGASFSQTFDTPGTFAYHCAIHPNMTATITVTKAKQPSAKTKAATAPPTAKTKAGTPAPGGADAGATGNLADQAEPPLAHIHAGSCDELGIVVYTLAGLRSTQVETKAGGTPQRLEMIVGTANVKMADLFGEPFSLHLHESAKNKQNYLACAEIGDQPKAPWQPADGLALRVDEQNDSGYSGIASLRPAADGGTTVTIFLAQSPAAAAKPAKPESTPPPSKTYSSPTFGYTIGYGPSWTVTENASTGGRDRFVLSNGTSYVTFTGAEGYGGDTDKCVEDFVTTLTADPNVSNLRLATDDSGKPAQGGTEATGAFAVYNHTYAFPDHSEDYTLFVGCIPLVPGKAVLAVVQNVPAADFNDQVAAREALLRGLTLPQ